MSETSIRQKVEPYLHFIPNFCAIVSTFYLFIADKFSNAKVACWLSVDNFSDKIIFVGIPFFAAFIVIIFNMTMIICSVVARHRKSNRWNISLGNYSRRKSSFSATSASTPTNNDTLLSFDLKAMRIRAAASTSNIRKGADEEESKDAEQGRATGLQSTNKVDDTGIAIVLAKDNERMEFRGSILRNSSLFAKQAPNNKNNAIERNCADPLAFDLKAMRSTGRASMRREEPTAVVHASSLSRKRMDAGTPSMDNGSISPRRGSIFKLQSDLRRSRSSISNLSNTETNDPLPRGQRRSLKRRRNEQREVVKQCLLYALSFFVSFIFGAIYR